MAAALSAGLIMLIGAIQKLTQKAMGAPV
jgi:hypothetical protein